MTRKTKLKFSPDFYSNIDENNFGDVDLLISFADQYHGGCSSVG